MFIEFFLEIQIFGALCKGSQDVFLDDIISSTCQAAHIMPNP
jgi:hypothetical protein